MRGRPDPHGPASCPALLFLTLLPTSGSPHEEVGNRVCGDPKRTLSSSFLLLKKDLRTCGEERRRDEEKTFALQMLSRTQDLLRTWSHLTEISATHGSALPLGPELGETPARRGGGEREKGGDGGEASLKC